MSPYQNSSIPPAILKNLNVPTLPEVVLRVNSLIEDPEVGTREIGALIAEDAPLAAKVLRIANSAFYGLSGQCVSTEHACTVLGTRVLRNIVTQVAVMGAFEHLDGIHEFDVAALWQHAILTAQISQKLAQRANRMTILSPEEHYVCGLLHDVGKIVMLDGLKEQYLTVAQVAAHDDLQMHVVERQHLGFDHTDVGAVVASRWGLPNAVADAIQYHHGPDDKVARNPVLALVAHTNQIAHCIADGNVAAAGEVIDVSVRKLLGLETSDVDDVVQELLDSLRSAA